MPDENEIDQLRREAWRTAMRQTVCEVHSEATTAGMTDPGALEDFIVGALQLEWPRLSDDAARNIARRFMPK
jgi:hypothetical protein